MKIKDNFNINDFIEATNTIYNSDFGSLTHGKTTKDKIKIEIEKNANQMIKESLQSTKIKIFKNAWQKKQR